MLIVCLALFNLQGTDSVRFARRLARSNFFILSHLIHFVKNFFQVFSKFFDVRRAPGFRRSSRNFYILSHLVCFVKNFFRSFSKFFRVDRRAFNFRLAAQLLYLNTSNLICQELFSSFFKFLCCELLSRDSLRILAHLIPFVKHFFTKTAHLFCMF